MVPGKSKLLGTLPSLSLSLCEVYGVRTELVIWSLLYGILSHLLCSPAATPQSHCTGSNQTLSDVDFGETSTREGTKDNRYDISEKGIVFTGAFLSVLCVCVCVYFLNHSSAYFFSQMKRKEPGRKQSY